MSKFEEEVNTTLSKTNSCIEKFVDKEIERMNDFKNVIAQHSNEIGQEMTTVIESSKQYINLGSNETVKSVISVSTIILREEIEIQLIQYFKFRLSINVDNKNFFYLIIINH